MEKILRRLIEYGLRGVDTYTHNGSTWLIFTDNKQWVIELTDNKTLWYNYNFFKQLFCVATDDVVENQKHITKWVEDNIINKELTYVTLFRDARDRKQQFEDTLENGVKNTNYWGDKRILSVDDTIQNGVKETIFAFVGGSTLAEDVLQNGVKRTDYRRDKRTLSVDDTLENGVKETIHVDVMKFFDNKMDDTLQNGVKITSPLQSREYTGDIDEVLRNGVRDSHPRQYVGGDIIDKVIVKGVIETYNDVYHHKGRIDGVIKNGVKETKEMLDWVCTDRMLSNILENGIKETKTPGKDGDILSTIEWMKENNSTSYPKMIEDVIENGVKETVAAGYTDPKTNLIYIKWGPQIDEVINEGVKISRTYIGGSRQKETTEIIIKYGTKNPTD
jgi:hypothetical protein